MSKQTDYDRDHFLKRYEEICKSASDTLFHKGMDLFDKMTPEERLELCDGHFEYFLPKMILVVVSDCIETEYKHSLMDRPIKKAKRIRKANRA